MASPSAPDPLSKVREALHQGRKVDAVRLYREATGAYLKEALEAVEAMRGKEGVPSTSPTPRPDPEALAPVAEALRLGNKIEAIKRYRELTGVGLKAAKEAIEGGAHPSRPATARGRQGCLPLLCGMVLLSLGLWIWS